MRPIFIVMLLSGVTSLLISCVTPPAVDTTAVCPKIVAYSAADERAALAELGARGAHPTLDRMLDDYAGERAMLRACMR